MNQKVKKSTKKLGSKKTKPVSTPKQNKTIGIHDKDYSELLKTKLDQYYISKIHFFEAVKAYLLSCEILEQDKYPKRLTHRPFTAN